VELPAPAGSPLALAEPLLLWLRRRDGACRARRRGYATLERRSGGLLGRGAVAVPGAGDLLVEFEDRWAAHPRAGAVLDRRVTVRGADPRWTGFATGLELPVPGGDGDCLWFAPGVLYRRNQHAPAGAIGSAAAGERPWVREDRLALPLIARLAPALGWWLGLLHLDAVAATADGDDLAAELTAAELSFGAFAGPGGRALAFTYPGSEGPVSYPPMGTLEIANTQADSPVRPFPAGARAATGWARRWTRWRPRWRTATACWCWRGGRAPTRPSSVAPGGGRSRRTGRGGGRRPCARSSWRACGCWPAASPATGTRPAARWGSPPGPTASAAAAGGCRTPSARARSAGTWRSRRCCWSPPNARAWPAGGGSPNGSCGSGWGRAGAGSATPTTTGAAGAGPTRGRPLAAARSCSCGTSPRRT
jgi:hypothetical protein